MTRFTFLESLIRYNYDRTTCIILPIILLLLYIIVQPLVWCVCGTVQCHDIVCLYNYHLSVLL